MIFTDIQIRFIDDGQKTPKPSSPQADVEVLGEITPRAFSPDEQDLQADLSEKSIQVILVVCINWKKSKN